MLSYWFLSLTVFVSLKDKPGQETLPDSLSEAVGNAVVGLTTAKFMPAMAINEITNTLKRTLGDKLRNVPVPICVFVGSVTEIDEDGFKDYAGKDYDRTVSVCVRMTIQTQIFKGQATLR